MPRQPPPSDDKAEPPGEFSYTNRPAFQGEYSPQTGRPPSAELLERVITELDAVAVRVEWNEGGRRLTGSKARTLPRWLLDLFRRYPDSVCDYLITAGRLVRPELGPPVPRPNSVIQWVGFEAEEHGVIPADLLPTKPWVRWRYRMTKRWYGYSGDSWEVQGAGGRFD